MMRILLVGNTGQLGWELMRTLAPLALGELTAVDSPEIDLAKPDPIRDLIRQEEPEVIINAAAYTAVDQAESDSESAMAVNGLAPGVRARSLVIAARFTDSSRRIRRRRSPGRRSVFVGHDPSLRLSDHTGR